MKSTVVTISRQYGSGGREAGKRLAGLLSVPYYDRELLKVAAEESGIREELFEQADERDTSARNSLLYSLVAGDALLGSHAAPYNALPHSDRLFQFQSEAIKKLAAKGSCVIVGRCSDYVLRDVPGCTNVFIHAGLTKRVERAVEFYGLPRHKAEETLLKIDKKRVAYYEYYSGQTWGHAKNYHLSLSSAVLGIDGCVNVILNFLEQRQKAT